MFQSESKSRETDVSVRRHSGRKNSVLGEGQPFLPKSSSALCSMGGPHPLFYSVCQFVLISSKNALTDTPRIMLEQISRHPVT